MSRKLYFFQFKAVSHSSIWVDLT